ncbi:hypothetical protein NQ317_016895 [Molorchus minor]|uniref:Gag protein n=1 Tax=Molorchus minor TaxID=1323400 RepID=A0ABQ9K539_9CUCU|nr:hypothetical protein NQ317_016895 [Molorchus minor]
MPNTVPVLDIKNLSIIPSFDGNPNKLHRFISVSETILNHYFDTQNTSNFQNTLLLNGILNKLEGRAEEVIGITGTRDWNSIKNALLQNFGDQRDENCLNQDLSRLKLYLNETFSQKQALKTFLAGLREPLGPIIRAMRPTTLAQALQFISEEDNVKYLQRSNQNNFVFKKPVIPSQQQQFRPQFPQMNMQQRPNAFPYSNSFSQFPRNPINIQRHPNPPTPRFPTNNQPNPSNAPPQNKPTPMSVSTRNTSTQFRKPYQNNFFSNNGQKPTVIAEELFNTEFCENQEPDNSLEGSYEVEESYDTLPEEQYENFQENPNLIEET